MGSQSWTRLSNLKKKKKKRMLISLGYFSWVDKGAEKEGPRDSTQQKIVLKARSVFCILELNITTICISCMSEQLLVKHLQHGKCVCAQSCPTLFDPMDCNLLGSSVHWISRCGYWSGLPFPPPGDLPDPGIKPTSLESPALAGVFFTTSAIWEA